MNKTAKLVIPIVATLIFAGIACVAIVMVSKHMSEKCPGGQTYDKTNKRCRPVCKKDEDWYPQHQKCLSPCFHSKTKTMLGQEISMSSGTGCGYSGVPGN